MNISDLGLDLIKHFEGCYLTAYYDSGGVLTIGWGHTGSDVYEGQTITQAQADALLYQDLQEFVQDVNSYATRDNLTQAQFDALVSFTYNTGPMAGKPTFTSYVNDRDYNNELVEMMLYIHDSAGNELEGLKRRRGAECWLYWYGENNFYPTTYPPFSGSPSSGGGSTGGDTGGDTGETGGKYTCKTRYIYPTKFSIFPRKFTTRNTVFTLVKRQGNKAIIDDNGRRISVYWDDLKKVN